jgi:hypothetical protein
MPLPKDIRNLKGTFKRIILLRSMRLHPGAAKSKSSDEPNPDTTSIDTYILLIRSMLSRGYEIKNPTPEETKLINLAWLDIGWELEKDMAWKREVINLLDPKREFSVDLSQLDLATILQLCDTIGLPHLHLRTETFQLLAPMPFHRDVGTNEWTMDVSEQRTHNSWDGTSSLDDRISRLFQFEKAGKEWVIVGKRPVFISIILKNSSAKKQNRIKFQSMRTFKLNSLIPVEEESPPQPTTIHKRPRLSSQDAKLQPIRRGEIGKREGERRYQILSQ